MIQRRSLMALYNPIAGQHRKLTMGKDKNSRIKNSHGINLG